MKGYGVDFFSLSNELLVVIEDGYFVDLSSTWEETLGWTLEELQSRPFVEFVHPEDRAATATESQRVENGGINPHFQNRYLCKDGGFRYLSWKSIADTERGLIFGCARDITEQLKSQQCLVESAKMSSLGQMAAGIAHEINNPLAIIQGKAEQLRDAIESGRADRELSLQALDRICRTAERIARIVRGLKAFSRNSEQDPMESMELSRLIDDALALCQERFRHHGIDLRVEIESPTPAVRCRGTQLEQVLMNLLSNAFDAVSELGERWVEIRAEHRADRLFVHVTDSGSGIPPEIATRMMAPFFTTKEIGRGTGLGLSISKGIVEEHGGELRYDSSHPRSRFTIELPLTSKRNDGS